jgi:DNA-binding transcriptional regulator YhcF (GntR family)
MYERTLTFLCKESDFTISFESQSVTADDVMQHFVQFMVGIGYGRDSVHESMREIVEEHDDYLKNYDGLKADLPLDLD